MPANGEGHTASASISAQPPTYRTTTYELRRVPRPPGVEFVVVNAKSMGSHRYKGVSDRASFVLNDATDVGGHRRTTQSVDLEPPSLQTRWSYGGLHRRGLTAT